jgi:hypothetical protein
MFQKAQTGSTDEYAQIEQTIDTQVLETIYQWLEKQSWDINLKQ